MFELVQFEDAVLFRGWDGIHGWELWRTDGTAKGTALVKDICPGQCSSLPWDFRLLLGEIYFAAADPDHGNELWRSDGTAEGTEIVADVSPGLAGSFPASLVEFEGEIYFRATDPEHGTELRATDGTPGGLRLVADLLPGPEGSDPRSLFVFGKSLFFTAVDEAAGREPWSTDGSEVGTSRLTDLCPGPEGSVWQDQEGPWGQRIFASSSGRLVISGHDAEGCDHSVWVSDGTGPGTEPIPGLSNAWLFPDSAPDGAVLFSAESAGDQELWRTDGTVGGTSRIADLNPTTGSHPREVGRASGTVFFSAWDGQHGIELWRTDGTGAGTTMVRDINPGSGSGLAGGLVAQGLAIGDQFFFHADDGVHGSELWVTDGTEEGTIMPVDINPGPAESLSFYSLVFSAALGDRLLTMARDDTRDWALWGSDGTPSGTEIVSDLDGQSSSTAQTWLGEYAVGWFSPKAVTAEGVVWLADDGKRAEAPWISDGRSIGTRRLVETCADCPPGVPRSPLPLVAAAGHVFWSVVDGPNFGVWASDGTTEGSSMVAPGVGFEIEPWFSSQGPRAIFSGFGLWLSDGTPEGTVQLSSTGTWQAPTPVGDRVFFASEDENGLELWLTDGTPEGTLPFVDLLPGPDSSWPSGLTAFGDGLLFFSAEDGVHGREPWVSDGTTRGTVLLADLRTGPEASIEATRERIPMSAGDRVFFAADDGVQGEELWVSDGTPEGTMSLGDLRPGPAGSEPRPLVAWNDVLYFSAFDDAHGRELWSTDGTVPGTHRVTDLAPGPASSIVDAVPAYSIALLGLPPMVWNDRLYFAATDGTTGVELWSTDASDRGATQVADLNPGPGSSSPNGFAVYADQLFFTATDGVHGYELWALGDPPPPDVLFEDGFESGDASAWTEVVP